MSRLEDLNDVLTVAEAPLHRLGILDWQKAHSPKLANGWGSCRSICAYQQRKSNNSAPKITRRGNC